MMPLWARGSAQPPRAERELPPFPLDGMHGQTVSHCRIVALSGVLNNDADDSTDAESTVLCTFLTPFVLLRYGGVPNGIRTRVLALKGPRPGPLDDGDTRKARTAAPGACPEHPMIAGPSTIAKLSATTGSGLLAAVAINLFRVQLHQDSPHIARVACDGCRRH
jgi:hypothetical protein